MRRGPDANRQDEIRAYLSHPDHWDGDRSRFAVMETHIAVIFLVGGRAYKMKKSIALGYLDFSTLEKRRWALERELALNCRNAAELYRRLVPVTARPGGGYQVDGEGAAQEWLLEMNRFEQDDLFSAMADRGALAVSMARPLAARISAMHRAARPCRSAGWHKHFAAVIASNETELFAAAAAGLTDKGRVTRIQDGCVQELNLHAEHLDARASGGWVRACHGDLHLDNIVLIGGEPVAFDCIEFSDDFACIDILYDIAFLLMDLRLRGLKPFASRFLNDYLAYQHEEDFEATLDAMALMPLYVAVRAGIRAHVTMQTAAQAQGRGDEAGAGRMLARAEAYMGFALEALEPHQPCLIAVGGFSGTGKSTLARGIAPEVRGVAGAVVLRSDEVRKRHFGVAMHEQLPDAAYREEVSGTVYARLMTEARSALAAGQSVILDAVFARSQEREAPMALARSCGVPFWGFWLEAEPHELARRIAGRRHDVSDATISVLERQMAYDVGDIAWIRLDAGRSPEAVLDDALGYLGLK